MAETYNWDSSMPTGAPGIVPRRSSYASVVSGQASAISQPYQPTRSGAFSHLLTQHNDFSYDPNYQSLGEYARYNSRPYDMNLGTNDGSRGIPDPWGRTTQLPSFSSAFGPLTNGNGFGGLGGGYMSNFFVPSYLKGSKYVQRLEEAHKVKMLAQKDGGSAPSSQPGSLSTSSSSINLHAKMAPSHRGMTFDVIEKAPPVDDEGIAPLPARWNIQDKNQALEVLSDGQEVKFNGPKSDRDREHEAYAIRADHAMPPQCGIYYFEVTIISKKREESSIGIGFSSKNVILTRLPGWEPESYAYHGDDGHSYCSSSTGKNYGPPFSVGDVIGCGVNFRTGSAFFTKNGDHLGTAFREVFKGKIYPSVGMKKTGEHIRVNFGQSPFVFDIDGMMSASFSSSFYPNLNPDEAQNGSDQPTNLPIANGPPPMDGLTASTPENTGLPDGTFNPPGGQDGSNQPAGPPFPFASPRSANLAGLTPVPPSNSSLLRLSQLHALRARALANTPLSDRIPSATQIERQQTRAHLRLAAETELARQERARLATGRQLRIPLTEGQLAFVTRVRSMSQIEQRQFLASLVAHPSGEDTPEQIPESTPESTSESPTDTSTVNMDASRFDGPLAPLGFPRPMNPGPTLSSENASQNAHDPQERGERGIIEGTSSDHEPPNAIEPLPGHSELHRIKSDTSANITLSQQQEKLQIREQIEKCSTASLAPPLNETELIQSLVLQFLTHDGYVETAKAFANEVHKEKKALNLEPNSSVDGFDVPEDEDAGHRQRIRTAVLEGDIEKALKLTNTFYPNVLKDNEHVYFRLRCRRFIEMIRQGAEMQNSTASNGTKATNGHKGDWYDDIINHDMDLDDHQQSNNWDRMDTEETPENQMEYQQLLQDTITYGQALQAEFKDDPRREVSQALQDAFALIAYQDPLNTKAVAHLLDPSGRTIVAEELNSVILLSLGKSSSAALERLCQQTTVLLEDLAADGGSGSLVNIDDFLRADPNSF